MNGKLSGLWATKNKDDEWWSSFITSPLAIGINYLVVDIKWLTPNIITLFSFVTAVISALFIISGGAVNFAIAAVLIHLSHVLDCMDGQMARYRNTLSLAGSFFDKATDQIQIVIWFGSVGYAAYIQTQNVLPLFLAFIGVSFYSLRGYVKYVAIYTQMSRDSRYLEKLPPKNFKMDMRETAGLGFSVMANLKWFVGEQRKFFSFDEGVFIFMLSLALLMNEMIPMLWVFALSQLFYGLGRVCQRGYQIGQDHEIRFEK